MSSLMQFNGTIDRKGVHLQFVHVEKVFWYKVGDEIATRDSDTDGIFMPDGHFYPRIWTAVRKPCGMCGCWVVFRYNGEKHVPDLSCPISIEKLPRDAMPMDNDKCIKTWKS